MNRKASFEKAPLNEGIFGPRGGAKVNGFLSAMVKYVKVSRSGLDVINVAQSLDKPANYQTRRLSKMNPNRLKLAGDKIDH